MTEDVVTAAGARLACAKDAIIGRQPAAVPGPSSFDLRNEADARSGRYSWSRRVRTVLGADLARAWDIGEVCRRLVTTESTLRRRLKSEHTSFRELLFELRLSSAWRRPRGPAVARSIRSARRPVTVWRFVAGAVFDTNGGACQDQISDRDTEVPKRARAR